MVLLKFYPERHLSGVITLEFSIHVEFVLVDSIGREKKERYLIGFERGGWERGWGGNEKRERERKRGREKENRSRGGGGTFRTSRYKLRLTVSRDKFRFRVGLTSSNAIHLYHSMSRKEFRLPIPRLWLRSSYRPVKRFRIFIEIRRTVTISNG